MIQIQVAQKKKVKLKIGMSGASGFGKTYSALLMAFGVVKELYPDLPDEDCWRKIIVIDTENESASLYADLGPYNVINLTAPFEPERYIEAVDACVKAGMEVAVIDSITHEWDGQGGCLESADKVTQASPSKNSYTAWAKVTPRHQAFVQKILQSPLHVITTVRRKQDYEMVNDSMGKLKVQKVGTKEITRDGFEYELTLNFEFTSDMHYVKASKDRTGLFMGKDEFIITSETGKQLIQWANSGKEEIQIALERLDKVTSREQLTEVYETFVKLREDPKFVVKLQELGKKYPKVD